MGVTAPTYTTRSQLAVVCFRMRLQLLAEWTNTVKRIGQRLICFMLLVFQADYGDSKVSDCVLNQEIFSVVRCAILPLMPVPKATV